MTSRSCRDILVHIEAYLDGELPEADCLTVESHCQACATCSALVEGLRTTVGLCRQVSTIPLPDDVRRRALEGVRALMARRTEIPNA